MKKFFRELVSDDNNINEKVFVGLIGLLMLIVTLVADLLTGLNGKGLPIHQFIFEGFLLLTLTSLGIATAGQIFKKSDKPEEKKAEEKESDPEV
jgi:hypothetical protein